MRKQYKIVLDYVSDDFTCVEEIDGTLPNTDKKYLYANAGDEVMINFNSKDGYMKSPNSYTCAAIHSEPSHEPIKFDVLEYIEIDSKPSPTGSLLFIMPESDVWLIIQRGGNKEETQNKLNDITALKAEADSLFQKRREYLNSK